MNKIQKQIIKELKEASNNLGRSPRRRDVPNLAVRCYKHFGSFNEAKKKVGLSIMNVRVLNFPKKVFKIDKDMAAIAAYLTTDGHLYKDLSGFAYYSKNINDLKEFEKLIKRKFGMKGKYRLNSGRGGITHSFLVFNKKISTELFKLGIPKGDKVIQVFNVPNWVSSSKEFSREYLKIAYLCEGTRGEEKGRTPRILFTMAKSEDILDSGLKFANTLKMMLQKFNIKTKKAHVTGKRLRKTDGKITRDIRFRVNIEDNDRFIKEIGWLK